MHLVIRFFCTYFFMFTSCMAYTLVFPFWRKSKHRLTIPLSGFGGGWEPYPSDPWHHWEVVAGRFQPQNTVMPILRSCESRFFCEMEKTDGLRMESGMVNNTPIYIYISRDKTYLTGINCFFDFRISAQKFSRSFVQHLHRSPVQLCRFWRV